MTIARCTIAGKQDHEVERRRSRLVFHMHHRYIFKEKIAIIYTESRWNGQNFRHPEARLLEPLDAHIRGMIEQCIPTGSMISSIKLNWSYHRALYPPPGEKLCRDLPTVVVHWRSSMLVSGYCIPHLVPICAQFLPWVMNNLHDILTKAQILLQIRSRPRVRFSP